MHKKEYKKCIILLTFAKYYIFFVCPTNQRMKKIYIYIPATCGESGGERERNVNERVKSQTFLSLEIGLECNKLE